jgi:hypothetical protein
MAVLEDRLDALARVYGQRQTQLRTRAAAAAERLFVASAADGIPAADVWTERYVRLITASQRATATATDVYMRQQLAVIGETVSASRAVTDIADLLISPETRWVSSPLGRMGRVLAAGQQAVETAADAAALTVRARAEAARYAGHLVHTEVRATERQTATRAYNTHWSTSEPLRWKRIPEAGACGWCRVVADRLYSAEFPGEWHTDCNCDWRMVTMAESNDWKPELRGDDWRDLITERADPDPVRSR